MWNEWLTRTRIPEIFPVTRKFKEFWCDIQKFASSPSWKLDLADLSTVRGRNFALLLTVFTVATTLSRNDIGYLVIYMLSRVL